MQFLVEIFCLMLCVYCCITVPVGSSGLHFDPAKTYKYSYEAEVIMNHADVAADDKIHKGHADIGLKVGAVFELHSRWTSSGNANDQVVEMQFQEAEIFNVSDRVQKDNSFHSVRRSKSLRSIIKPLIFRWRDGKVEELYVNSGETVTSLNVKRGMLGLLQLQTRTGKRDERDPSGQCNVAYVVDDHEVKKVKDVASCQNNEESFASLNQILGVTTSATSRALYTLSEDMTHILFAVAMESHSIRVNVKQDIGLTVLGRQKLGLMDTVERKVSTSSSKDTALQNFASERKKHGEKYIRESLISSRDVKDCAEGCLNIKDVLDQFHAELTKENMANRSSVQAYVTAVRAARQADKKVLAKMMKSKANKDIRLTLIDVLAATQTPASQAVLMKQLDFSKTEETGDIERALSGIAFSSHPSETVVKDLKNVFRGEIASPKIRETVALALGAILNKFCKSGPGNCRSKTASEVKNIIEKGLVTAKTEAEQTLYIQFVRNSALPEFIPKLLEFGENSEFPLVNHLAITSLGVYDSDLLDSDARAVMSRIYHQNEKQYETTVRSAAANLLLMSNPTRGQVENIFLSLPHQKSKELSNFVYARMRDLIKTNHPSKSLLLNVLQDPKYGNYWTLAQSGMASAFTGRSYTSADSFGTYALFMEYSNAGMMRRTAVDFSLNGMDDSIALTQLGIVAQGLEGLTGSDPDEGEENLDSMVGMASTMMGVKLRPLTFFRGYSDMMSMIWSGGSGDSTGVEAMLLLTDHLQHVLLASGLRVKAEVLGAISTEITAEINFSLWNRNVEIVTTNGGALTIQCRFTLESPIVRASVRNAFDGQGALQVSVFTDFSSLPPKSCIRLSHPPFEYETTLRKFERVQGSAKRLLTMRRKRRGVLGVTLPLHQGNSQMCAKIVAS